jgi:hypothetical protein
MGLVPNAEVSRETGSDGQASGVVGAKSANKVRRQLPTTKRAWGYFRGEMGEIDTPWGYIWLEKRKMHPHSEADGA